LEEKLIGESDASVVESVVSPPTLVNESSTGKLALALVARYEMEMAMMPFITQGAVVVFVRFEELGYRLLNDGNSTEELREFFRFGVLEDVNGAIPLESEIAPAKKVLGLMQKKDPVLEIIDAELLILREIRHVIHPTFWCAKTLYFFKYKNKVKK